MKEKIIKNRKYILITLAILISIAFNIGMRYLATRPRYKTLPEVRLRNQKEESTDGFAIMVPNESGDGYVEYEGDTWPTEYKYVEAKCMDNKGEEVENAATYKDGKVELQTDKTVYCTLYFDNKIFKSSPTIDILREKDTQGYLSEDEQGGMYRYQATPTSSTDAANMTNWICFGTKDQSECTNNIDKYMYRIIGITKEGQMYLIKETFLKEGSTTGFAWNTAWRIDSGSGVNYCSGGVCPEWNEADLFKRINGKANGTTSGNGSSAHADTDIFVDSTQYDYLKSGDENGTNDGIGNEWYNLIADHDWMYGDTVDQSSNIYNGYYMYKIETGNKETQHYFGPYKNSQLTPYTWPETNKVEAKISLMYMHDVDYAYPVGIPESAANVVNSWIFHLKDGINPLSTVEWLSTRWSVDSPNAYNVFARFIDERGQLHCFDALNRALGVRPVFYLSSEAKIEGGDGEKYSPFVLSVQIPLT